MEPIRVIISRMVENVLELMHAMLLRRDLDELIAPLSPEQISETTLSRLLSHMAKGKDGFVLLSPEWSVEQAVTKGLVPDETARSFDRLRQRNNEARAQLVDNLVQAGLSFSPVIGVWKGNREQSFFVPGVSQERAMELARTMAAPPFEQDAILWGRLAGEAPGVFLLNGTGVIDKIGNKVSIGAVGDAYSQLKRARKDTPARRARGQMPKPDQGAGSAFQFQHEEFGGFHPVPQNHIDYMHWKSNFARKLESLGFRPSERGAIEAPGVEPS